MKIGDDIILKFLNGLPNGFYKPLKTKLVTMKTIKKGIKVGDSTIFNMEKLYGRLLVISTKRNLLLESVPSYELPPILSELFDEYGHMKSSNKAVLINKLAVQSEYVLEPEVEVVHGSAILYHVNWPQNVTVRALC